MRLVIALGGNALQKRGEPMRCDIQQANVRIACEKIAKAYEGNELVITHGNGPQVGLIALQNNAYKEVPMYPLDVLGAESVGMIGYLIQQELVNFIPKSATVATVLTQTQVDPEDPAFKHPTKPVGPVYTKEEAEELAKKMGRPEAHLGPGTAQDPCQERSCRHLLRWWRCADLLRQGWQAGRC